MRFNIFYYSIFFITVFAFGQSNTIDLYTKSLDEIFKTKEYKELNKNGKSFYVSEEILYYDLFSRFFEKELPEKSNYNINIEEVVSKNEELLNLNKKNCGKVKIFFSEIKNNTFFTEVFIEKKKKLKYNDRTFFGSSYVFLFRIYDNNIVLIKIKEMHYN